MPLARSFAIHLLAPYAAHLGLAYLLIVTGPTPLGLLFLLILAFGGWLAVLPCIPFGVLHVLQAIRYAPGWSPRTQFLTGLLNPSLAFLTIIALLFLGLDSLPGL